jgi:hypothetical protein
MNMPRPNGTATKIVVTEFPCSHLVSVWASGTADTVLKGRPTAMFTPNEARFYPQWSMEQDR